MKNQGLGHMCSLPRWEDALQRQVSHTSAQQFPAWPPGQDMVEPTSSSNTL